MPDLTQLLKDLGQDASLEADYEKNPESVLVKYDLSEDERKAMLNLDVEAVRRLSGIKDAHLTNSSIKAPGG